MSLTNIFIIIIFFPFCHFKPSWERCPGVEDVLVSPDHVTTSHLFRCQCSLSESGHFKGLLVRLLFAVTAQSAVSNNRFCDNQPDLWYQNSALSSFEFILSGYNTMHRVLLEIKTTFAENKLGCSYLKQLHQAY